MYKLYAVHEVAVAQGSALYIISCRVLIGAKTSLSHDSQIG